THIRPHLHRLTKPLTAAAVQVSLRASRSFKDDSNPFLRIFEPARLTKAGEQYTVQHIVSRTVRLDLFEVARDGNNPLTVADRLSADRANRANSRIIEKVQGLLHLLPGRHLIIKQPRAW